MVKTVFIDYMGTTVDERSPEMAEIVRRICENSDLHDPKQVQRFILDTRRRYEADSYLDAYRSEDELAEQLISDMAERIGLMDEPSALLSLIRGHWVNAPVFPDARIFFEQCAAPIYIITNNGLPYMEQALRRNRLKAAGVVSGDTVRAYKPTRRYSTRLCGSVAVRRMRPSISGTPTTPTLLGRAARGSSRCWSFGDGRGSMTIRSL